MTTEKPQPDMSSIAAMLRNRFVDCAASAANEADVEQVMDVVIKDLNAAKREVTLKMLGLENRWGKWEVDHCNGRNSPISAYLDEECKALVKEWVQSAVKEVLTKELKAKKKKEITDSIKSELANQASYSTRTMIMHAVENFNKQILDNVTNELRQELGLKPV